MRLAGGFCQLRVFGQLLLPSALMTYRVSSVLRQIIRHHALPTKFFLRAALVFKSRFLMWARDEGRVALHESEPMRNGRRSSGNPSTTVNRPRCRPKPYPVSKPFETY